MPWHALLRVVDFQELLASQAPIADALEASRKESGTESDETRALREGFNLLAKVLFTQRANARDLHDLAWLDHLVVAKRLGPAKTWRGERVREALDHLTANRGRMGQLLPGRHGIWVEVPLAGVAGLATLKLECATVGGLRAGAVAQEGLLELVAEIRSVSPRTPEGTAFLEDANRLALAGRHVGGESVALVLAASEYA